ncbi:glycosyltransferase [Cellulomonas algicola]|uniref:glycosyltransferase n=1 Tax=Cellulomonas algicola TaxID=2071633 RepID=UPI001C3FE6CF|nr:glycosyltransferase [Cellulomonas algicola]
MTLGTPPVVVLSTADFDSAVWTNKQHLAVGLARHADVTYVESFGLRAPTVSGADLRRVARRAAGRRGGGQRTAPSRPDRLRVVSPRVVPFHGAAAARRLNAQLVRRLDLPGLDEGVLWTFSPMTYGLERRARHVVYHSVDLLHTQPRVPAAALLDAERHLLRVADRVVASSTGVAAHLRAQGRDDVLLWENVADVELFAGAAVPRRPRAVFAGNLTPTKVDVGLLLDVVDRGLELVLAGPHEIDGAGRDGRVGVLLSHPRVTTVGNLPPDRLAEVVAGCTVGLVPYALNDYTAGVFPLKVYEYLAAGLAVVSTPLASLRETTAPGLSLVEASRFGAAAVAASGVPDPVVLADRRAAAASHSWTARVADAVALVDGFGA